MKIEIIHPFFVREPLFRHKPFVVSSTVIKKFVFERASLLVLEVLWIDWVFMYRNPLHRYQTTGNL